MRNVNLPKIVGLSGLAGSGKDTLADLLSVKEDYVKIALADPMKHFCKEVFEFTDEQLWGPSACRNAGDPRYVREWVDRGQDGSHPVLLTPRFALQTLGTEWGRVCYENVWIDYALRKAERWNHQGYNVVIPDIRFKNELDAIHKAGGVVWRIERAGSGLEGQAAAHASENGLRSDDCDRVLRNDGTKDDLYRFAVGS